MKRPETWDEAVDEVLADLRATLVSKQRDYGPHNILDFGELGVLIRANDKMARLRNLLWERRLDAHNEPVEDSWRDLAGYAVIALMLRQRTFSLPLEGDPA